jgi:hypothetical protein
MEDLERLKAEIETLPSDEIVALDVASRIQFVQKGMEDIFQLLNS